MSVDRRVTEMLENGAQHIRVEGGPGPGQEKKYTADPFDNAATVMERDEPEEHTVFAPDPVAAEEAAANAYGYGRVNCGFVSREELLAQVMGDGLLPTGEASKTEKRINDLRSWWMKKASMDVEMVAEKAVTYGSNSLEQLGRKMAQLNGRRDISAEEAQELGCWVYLTGKAERWTDAVMRGERPKDDTILDIAMYATMAARIRWSGGWPDSQG